MLGRGSYKAAKGVIKVNVQVQEDNINKTRISGDFFMYPEDSLWELKGILLGASAGREDVLLKVKEFY